MHSPLRIGTRGSQLALWQARTVATTLEARGIAAELVIIRTTGDRLQTAPLSEVGGKRLFVKEIEDALLRDEIDVAVHSAKDMPAELPDGLGGRRHAAARGSPRRPGAAVRVAWRRHLVGALTPWRAATPRHQQRQAHRAAGRPYSGRRVRADPR